MSVSPEVGAVLTNTTAWGLCPKWCNDDRVGPHSHDYLRALTNAGYAVIKIPAGVEVRHGARLKMGYSSECLYVIESPE